MYHIKVVDIAPKITFLGANIDEAVHLQKQHDIVFKQLQVSLCACVYTQLSEHNVDEY